MTDNAVAAFIDAMRAAGIDPPATIKGDGRLHRFSTNGRRDDDGGWYILHLDGIPAGAFGDWRTSASHTWCARSVDTLTPSEREAWRARIEQAKRDNETARERARLKAAKEAEALWKKATPAGDDHPYLVRKFVKSVATLRELSADAVTSLVGYTPKANGETLSGRILIVPIVSGMAIASVQFIDEAGQKAFLRGGAVAGGYWATAKLPDSDGAALTVLIAEGVATALSADEATEHFAIAAMSAGNLPAVARALHIRFPKARLVLLADLDPSGVGVAKATEAAHAVDGVVAVPEFGIARPDGAKDFNDLAAHRGIEAVRAVIETVKQPGEPGHCEQADLPERTVMPNNVLHFPQSGKLADFHAALNAEASAARVAKLTLLDGLIDRTKADPGAPFASDVVAQIGELFSLDRPAFERLRAKLKEAGCRVTALDDVIAKTIGDTRFQIETQAAFLLELAKSAELFHTRDGTAYGDISLGSHRETWPLSSKGFRRWLCHRFFEAKKGAANGEAIRSAVGTLEAKATYDAPERPVFVRVGAVEGRLYLDLADEKWRAVEIDTDGWRIVKDPPVRFRRASGMAPLPSPQPGGSIDELRSLLNVVEESDFVLLVAWLLAAFRDTGPYPVIVLGGEQGTAKSTLSATLRALVDPNTSPLRALPHGTHDMFISATNSYVLAFDNVTGLPNALSDTICRLATGGGFATRQLYSDLDETLFAAMRPTILNGIEDVVSRPDLADRSLFFMLQPISEDRRRTEAELKYALEEARPRILGVLLDAVAHGLRRLPETRLEKLPRMADFALWATACEGALWPAGTFEVAYAGNRAKAVEDVLDADPVAVAVRSIMAAASTWEGTASDLLAVLGEAAGETARKSKHWPDSPRALAGRLRRSAAFLRKVGLEIAFWRKPHIRARMITITTLSPGPDKPPQQWVPPSPSVPADSNPSHLNELDGTGSGTRRGTDGTGRGNTVPISSPRPVPSKPLKTNAGTDGDGGTANSGGRTDGGKGTEPEEPEPNLPAFLDRRARPR